MSSLEPLRDATFPTTNVTLLLIVIATIIIIVVVASIVIALFTIFFRTFCVSS
jgi:hypothetical protein